MPVVLVIGIIAILVGVFAVATGRGGELAYEHADHAPLDLGPVSATDVALLRPPTALWGYNMQVTDEALDSIARALRDRDIEIATLQRQLADLSHGRGAHAGQGKLGSAEPELADEVEPPRHFVPKHERPRTQESEAPQLGDHSATAEESSEQPAERQQEPDEPDDQVAAADEPDGEVSATEELGW